MGACPYIIKYFKHLEIKNKNHGNLNRLKTYMKVLHGMHRIVFQVYTTLREVCLQDVGLLQN